MDCKTASAMLEAYLDNELDRADARELEAHVDDCPACRAELSRLGELRQALRDGSLRYTAPPSLRDRILREKVDVPTSPARGAPNWMRFAAAAALAFVLGGSVVQLWNTSSARSTANSQLVRDLFASHWRALAATSAVDVVSSDRHTVKPWFAGKIAEAPVVQDFADQGFPLVGGRIDYLDTNRVAVLVYRHGQHLIDVFVLPTSEHDAIASAERQGYALSTAQLGTQTGAIISDMDATERARFESLLANRPQ